MATPVYSTLFGGLQGVDINYEYVVPAGYIAVVRSVVALFPESAGDTAAAVYDTFTGAYIFYHLQVNPYEFVNETMHQVVQTGSTLELQSSGGGDVSLRVSGYLLTTP